MPLTPRLKVAWKAGPVRRMTAELREHDHARQRCSSWPRLEQMYRAAGFDAEGSSDAREISQCAAALILLLGASLPCAAQNAPPAPNLSQSTAPQLRDAKACAQGPGATLGQGTRTDRGAPAAPDSGAPTLSDKLARDRWRAHLPSPISIPTSRPRPHKVVRCRSYLRPAVREGIRPRGPSESCQTPACSALPRDLSQLNKN